MTITPLKLKSPFTSVFDEDPTVIFAGLSRAGKTSIIDVVYRRASPHETVYMDPTTRLSVLKVANTNLARFNILDVPGGTFQDIAYDELLFQSAKALIFVIDAQNEPFTAEISYCKSLFRRVWLVNSTIHFAVFIHKVDGDYFSVDEVRAECHHDIHNKLLSYLQEEHVAVNVEFYSTSIYDQTIFEACSRVIQSLLPHTNVLEKLLDVFIMNSRMEKAFLIDVLSKTFIATDSSPFDPFNYELCTEMVDVIIDISCVYGQLRNYEEAASAIFRTNKYAIADEDKIKDDCLIPLQYDIVKPIEYHSGNAVPTTCVIQLTSEYVLYLREVDKFLVLACVTRGENFDRQYLVDHNIREFQKAMIYLVIK